MDELVLAAADAACSLIFWNFAACCGKKGWKGGARLLAAIGALSCTAVEALGRGAVVGLAIVAFDVAVALMADHVWDGRCDSPGAAIEDGSFFTGMEGWREPGERGGGDDSGDVIGEGHSTLVVVMAAAAAAASPLARSRCCGLKVKMENERSCQPRLAQVGDGKSHASEMATASQSRPSSHPTHPCERVRSPTGVKRGS